MSKHIIVLIIAAAGLLIAGAIWDATQLQPPSKTSETVSQEPEKSEHDDPSVHSIITVKDITLHECEKRKGYELVVKAHESKFCPSSGSVECCSVMCNITRNGTSVAALHAEKSLIDRIARHVIFAGPVAGSLKDLQVQGFDLQYNFSTQTVQTNKKICYKHPSFTLQAGASIVDVNAQKIVMVNGVCSEFLYSTAADNSGK
jgi:hypothetical protein